MRENCNALGVELHLLSLASRQARRSSTQPFSVIRGGLEVSNGHRHVQRRLSPQQFFIHTVPVRGVACLLFGMAVRKSQQVPDRCQPSHGHRIAVADANRFTKR